MSVEKYFLSVAVNNHKLYSDMGVTKRVYADRCELARYNYRRTAGISALDMVMTIMSTMMILMSTFSTRA